MSLPKSPLAALLLFSIMLIVSYGCKPFDKASIPPVTGTAYAKSSFEELTIYSIVDLSSCTDGRAAVSLPAFEDFSSWLNSQGGINGVKVNWEWFDTGADRARAVAAYNTIRQTVPEPAMVVIFDAVDAQFLGSKSVEDSIVILSIDPPSSAVWPPSYTFGLSPSYEDYSGAFLDWLSNELSARAATRKCKLAFLNPDVPEGHRLSSEEIIEYCTTKPYIEIVSNDYYDYSSADISEVFKRIMQNDPDYVFGLFSAANSAVFLKSLESSGFLGKVKVATAGTGMQPDTYLDIDKKYLEGVVGPHYFPQVMPPGLNKNNSGVFFAEMLFRDSNRPIDQWGSSYVKSLGTAFWVSELIEYTVRNTGWDKFNGESFLKHVQNIKSVDCGGIIKWGLASGGKRTNSMARIFQFNRDGYILPLSDYITAPDLRPVQFRKAEYGWSEAGWIRINNCPCGIIQ